MKKVLCLILSVAFTVMLTSCKPALSSAGRSLIKPVNRVGEEDAVAFFEDKNPIEEISVKFKYENSSNEEFETGQTISAEKWSGEAYFSSFRYENYDVGNGTFKCKVSGKDNNICYIPKIRGKDTKYYRKATEKYVFCKTESDTKVKVDRVYEYKYGNKVETEKKSETFLLSEEDIPGSYLVSMGYIYSKGYLIANIIGTKSGEADKYVSEHTMYIKGSKIAAVTSTDSYRQITIYTFNGANLKSVEYFHENAFGSTRATINVVDKVSIDI